jgi:hypothetical protein
MINGKLNIMETTPQTQPEKNNFVDNFTKFINDMDEPEKYFDEVAPTKEVKEILELISTIEKIKKKIDTDKKTDIN